MLLLQTEAGGKCQQSLPLTPPFFFSLEVMDAYAHKCHLLSSAASVLVPKCPSTVQVSPDPQYMKDTLGQVYQG